MDFDEYQRRAVTTSRFPREIALAYLALGIAGEAGEVAEKVKKIYRDNGGVVDDERRAQLLKEMGDCLWYMAVMADELGVPFNDVAERNFDKLADRDSRNVIHGEGDER